jgi:hypothetical protein
MNNTTSGGFALPVLMAEERYQYGDPASERKSSRSSAQNITENRFIQLADAESPMTTTRGC